jgi:thiosulfate/3-mercaptopyruvate sulfurtransferase
MKDNSTAPLIRAEAIGHILDNPNVILVDARGGADAAERYRAGHLRGALRMDLETDLSERSPDASHGGRHPLPDPAAFSIRLGEAGIDPSSHILVYDDKAGANAAARFWWMMKAAGHEQVQVIDGGLAAIEGAGLPISRGSEPHRKPLPPYPFTAWNLPVADIEAVDRARMDPGSLVIDVREGFRYRGESEPIDLIAGHIPGAINVPYANNLSPDGRFLSPEALASRYKDLVGDKSFDNVIVHCGSGVTACHTLLALASAGLPTPRLYVGSWSEWSRNARPMATSENPD